VSPWQNGVVAEPHTAVLIEDVARPAYPQRTVTAAHYSDFTRTQRPATSASLFEMANVNHEPQRRMTMKKLPRSLTVIGAGRIASSHATIFAFPCLALRVTWSTSATACCPFIDREITDAPGPRCKSIA